MTSFLRSHLAFLVQPSALLPLSSPDSILSPPAFLFYQALLSTLIAELPINLPRQYL